MYAGDAKPNSGLKGIEQFISRKYDKKTSLEVMRELNKCILPYDTNKIYKLQLSSNRFIVMDYRQNEATVQNIEWKKAYDIACKYGKVLSLMPNDKKTCKNILEEEFGYDCGQ